MLVILGLLTGGILAGQSLIRAAELRSVTTQASQYRAAVYSFRDKYFALPGDMTNATAFWQSAGGTGSDNICIAAQSTASPATCNGNGDGLVFNLTGWDHAERFMAWKHLANAGLIEGNYSGVTEGAVANSYVQSVGKTNPAGRLGQSFFDISYVFPNAIYFNALSATSKNSITIYAASGNAGVMAPEEAWNVDTKLDDGSPVYGSVYTTKKTSVQAPNCASSDAADATYDFSIKSLNCIMLFNFL